jgi:isoleucyl-tRNA synthetase
MQRCAELYRKLRNTFKILLGNLNGFNPATDAVPADQLLPLDRYMLARTRELTEKILGFYETFEFHRVYHAVNEFAIVDLSAFYIDVLKDRMYTFAPTNPARRSAQTALWKITEALVRLVAPILSFTADEVWEHLPHVEGREESVHLALFPKPEEIFDGDLRSPQERWNEQKWHRLFEVREIVFRALEEERKSGRIGKGLGARIVIQAPAEDIAQLEFFGHEMLQEFFNVSEVSISEVVATPSTGIGTPIEYGDSGPLSAKAFPASGTKCNRCLRYTHDTSSYGVWQDVCTRCQSALKEMKIDPPQEAA